MSADLWPDSHNGIERVLADLKHLDLSGLVEYETPKWPMARGGYGDVFRGSYKRPDGSQTKVAIKCLMRYLDGSRDTARLSDSQLQVEIQPASSVFLDLQARNSSLE
ncbi:hypothetical protein ACEPAF_9030 [Sanghuangporus sanghuang]